MIRIPRLARRAAGLAVVGFSAAAIAFVTGPRTPPQESSRRLPTAPTAADVSAEAAGPKRSTPLPDPVLTDQHGRRLRFYSDLVDGRFVVINFVFTTCKGICPTQGALFGKLRERLGGADVRFISISIDPVNDTPGRLAEWSERFGAGDNWTLLTGPKAEVDGLLKALDAFNADKNGHAPLVLLGDGRDGRWRRVNSLSSPDEMERWITRMAASRRPEPAPAAETPAVDPDTARRDAARRYFTDVALTDQDGRAVRFYDDVLRDKVVVIHSFFSSCKGSCPRMMGTYRKIQDHLGHRLGRDVHLISLTVDPNVDSPAELRAYGNRLGAKPGWFFLGGPEDRVRSLLAKLGMNAPRREEHSNVFLVGNDRTGLWKKVQGLGDADEILRVLDGVLDDRGADAPSAARPVPEG